MEPIKFTKEILAWLHNRGLTNQAIQESQLSWNGEEIVIPVFDEFQKLIFNKYRRSPFNSEGPKYRYEKGSTSAFFNVHTLKNVTNEPVFICEGELDCLLLNSLGLFAATSTGGSGTFKKEWASHFEDKNVFIIFDKDDAGYKGAMKVQGIIPHAKVIFLNDDMEGNDITDYFQNHTLQDFFALEARSYPVPREPSGMPADKKSMRAVVKAFGDAADELLSIKQEFMQTRRNVRPILVMLDYARSRYETYNHTLKSFDRKFEGGGDSQSVLRAKEVPITQFIQFNYDGFAKCVWHNEKSGSMKYNKPGTKYPNTVKCYGCGMMGDTIDVTMQIRNVDFNNAIKIILNNE